MKASAQVGQAAVQSRWLDQEPEEPSSAIHPQAGPQSTQAPIGNVTARLLVPSHGGITAPNPPAGPPAATTSSWSGDSSAVYTVAPRSRTTAALPHSAHSRRCIRALS